MIERQTRMQIDAQDVRERALLARMWSPRGWFVNAVLGFLLLVILLATAGLST